MIDFIDGIWLDMNEASNFCGGFCYNDQVPIKRVGVTEEMYIPTGRSLSKKSIPIQGIHSNGFYEADTHSTFGALETKATRNWFDGKSKRGLIIGRSTLAGSGKWGSHWLGDNWSAAVSMGYSVYGVLAMNLFGIPMVGADICGFSDNTTPELCAKWHMVGATYPFSRNHNAHGNIGQEPA